jgi:phosphatidylglycerol:prolipoprotein diacylglycerol transferase
LQTVDINSNAIAWTDLHLSPVALDLGFFELRWYSLAYLAGIIVGYWYLLKILKQPGAPMARRHADDLKLWDGGMSFHGGVIGTSLGILYLARKEKLPWLRVHDYVACCVPFGLFFGRLANFVNHELWGAPTNVPWAVRFPEIPTGQIINGVPELALGPARHPTQLYEAGLEGILLFAILWLMFWKSDARYQPGRLVGAFIFFYGIFRFCLELIREPDAQLKGFAAATGLHMGQWLSLPMIIGGLFLMITASKRRVRVEPTLGTESVA